MKSRVTGYSLWTWPLVDLDTFTDKRKKKKKRLTLIYGSLPALIRMSKGSGCEKVCAGLSLSLSVFLCPRWTPLVFWTACKRDCDSVLSAIKEILGWEGPLSEQRSGGWNCQRDLGILSENNWVFMRVVFFFLLLGARTHDWITLSRTLISTFSPKMYEKLSAGMEGDSSRSQPLFHSLPWIHFGDCSRSGGGSGSLAGHVLKAESGMATWSMELNL